MPDIGKEHPDIQDLEQRSAATQKRMSVLIGKYRLLNYMFFTEELVGGDVVRLTLPAAETDGMRLAESRILAGAVTLHKSLSIEFDSTTEEPSLVSQVITPGGWGNLDVTSRGGYFPTMLSHGFAFGYHITDQGRSAAESLLVPFSTLEVNGAVIFNQDLAN